MSRRRLGINRLVPQRKLPHWGNFMDLCLAGKVDYLLDTDLQEQGCRRVFRVVKLSHGKRENSCQVEKPEVR
jgi:hypothetical protein